jgi:hypothetical protein
VAAIDLLPRPEVGPAETDGTATPAHAAAPRSPVSPEAPPVASPTPAPISTARSASPQSSARPAWRPEGPRPTRPRVSFKAMRGLHQLLERNRLLARLAARLEAAPPLYQAFTWAEKQVKERLFGCRMCAQCALPSTAYACPMTCPKQLRNGPCGGVAMDGSCEVYPGTRCVWLIAYERAEQDHRVSDLRRLQRPVDQRKWGQSSWVNYWLGRDDGLWTDDSLQARQPGRRIELPILPSQPAATAR